MWNFSLNCPALADNLWSSRRAPQTPGVLRQFTLVEHYSGVHLKEGRSLGGGTFQDRRHNNHGARPNCNPKGYGKGKTRGFTRRTYVAEDETHSAYDDAYPQEDEEAEDYDDTSYPAFGDEPAEYEAHYPPGRRTQATALNCLKDLDPEEAESGHVIQLQLAANAAKGRARGRKGKGKGKGKSIRVRWLGHILP